MPIQMAMHGWVEIDGSDATTKRRAWEAFQPYLIATWKSSLEVRIELGRKPCLYVSSQQITDVRFQQNFDMDEPATWPDPPNGRAHAFTFKGQPGEQVTPRRAFSSQSCRLFLI